MSLVLASRSPRRAELLTRAGYEFVVVPADVDEIARVGESPMNLVKRLARKKVAVVAELRPEAVVLGADTVVVDREVMLGKPIDESDAAAMLRRLSGRTHEVLTGVALAAAGQCWDDAMSTQVMFRELDDDDISWYLASGEMFGKAGGYAIQGLASRFVTRIEGSYTNVVGLPISVVDNLLQVCRRANLTAGWKGLGKKVSRADG
mgnify:CR=1 FL=1